MTEQDIDRLEALLASDTFKGEAMPLDTLQGFLCAVASGPEDIPPAEWLPEVLGPDPDYASPTAQQDAEAAVLAFYQSVRAELAAGEDFDLILYAVEEGSEELDYAAWCDGYVYGCQMGQRDWFAAAGEYADDLREKMEVFFLLNGLLREDALKHKEPWLSPEEEARALEEAREALPEVLGDLFRFWRALAPSAPQRREAPKVGRNAPCPCGSGKKYKLCCGQDTD